MILKTNIIKSISEENLDRRIQMFEVSFVVGSPVIAAKLWNCEKVTFTQFIGSSDILVDNIGVRCWYRISQVSKTPSCTKIGYHFLDIIFSSHSPLLYLSNCKEYRWWDSSYYLLVYLSSCEEYRWSGGTPTTISKIFCVRAETFEL